MKKKGFSLCRVCRWLVRFRHRCGYGIHSPFAFRFVTDVIYSHGEYYAYAPLARMRKGKHCPLREKDDRLLLRLANASRADEALIVGTDTAVSLRYLRAGRRHCRFVTTETAIPAALRTALSGVKKLGLVYAAPGTALEAVVDTMLPLTRPQTLFVLADIHASRANTAAWHHLQADERVRVTFDLYDFGLAVFIPRLNKQNYVINYF